MEKQEGIKKKKDKEHIRMPHIFVILFMIVLGVALLTYIIPAGQYARIEDPNTGREILDVTSFSYVEKNPTTPMDLFRSIPEGLIQTSEIVFLILIIGGAMEVITKSGALVNGIGALAKKLGSREHFMIPMFLFVFAWAGAILGTSDEVCVFVPMGILMAKALGYDVITGTAMVSLGAAFGITSGIFIPFTVGVAQQIAGLPLYSGAWFRLIAMVTFYTTTLIYLTRYAKKVKADPTKSYMYGVETDKDYEKIDFENIHPLTKEQKIVLTILFAGIALIIFGIIKYRWYINEMSAVYLAIAIFSGLVAKMTPSEIAITFTEGAKELIFGALVVGLAKSISVIMVNANIIDTIVYGLSSVISLFPRFLSSLGIYFINLILNFFITSGSGLAATSMPIMVPLADVLGLTRQTAVLAFQFGDGFTNSIIPTSSELMAYLAVAGIPYTKWVKFIKPLMIVWILSGVVLLLIADAIKIGPF